MLGIIDPSAKKMYGSLFSTEEVRIPPWEHGETRPLVFALADPIPSPIGARVFEPRNLTGYIVRAALGRGMQPPLAGTYYLLTGIAHTAGLLTTGKRYKIVDFVAGDVFTNIGAASNTTGVVFTATGTTPTTWTNASEIQEITANLAFDAAAAAVETALNNTHDLATAGGVTVEDSAAGFLVTFVTPGPQPQITGFSGNLVPLSTIDAGTLIDGDASTGLQEIQNFNVIQNPGALVQLTITNDPAGAAVIPVQTGGAGLNAKVRVSLTSRSSGALVTGGIYLIRDFIAGDDFTNVGGTNVDGNIFTATGTAPTTWTNKSALQRLDALPPYDGKWSVVVAGLETSLLDWNASQEAVVAALESLELTSGLLVVGRKYKIVEFLATDDFTNVGATANATGNVFVASGTTPTDWAGLSRLSPVAEGNVAVFREDQGEYLISFQGDMANTAMGSITADGSALQVIPTLSASIDLRTSGIAFMLNGEDEVAVTFEAEATPPGGTLQKVFRDAAGTLIDSVIDPSNTQPPQRVSWALQSVAGKYRFKDDGTFQLYNADQAAYHSLTVTGAAGAEILEIGAGEA